MSKKFTEEAVVRIWKNQKRLGIVPTGHFGHASLTMRSEGYLVNRDFDHISWWPGEGADKKDFNRWQPGGATEVYGEDKNNEMRDDTAKSLERGFQAQQKGQPLPQGAFLPRSGQKRMEWDNPDTGVKDVFWLQSADAKVYLPGLSGKPVGGGEPVYWGLSTSRMWNWWKKWKALNQYKLGSATHNCAGVAGLGIEAGGGTAFAPFPKVTLYMEPQQILNWAKEIEAKLTQYNQQTAGLDAEVTQYLNSHPRDFMALKHAPVAGDLWKPNEWKESSALSGKMRSPLIHKIDSALERFHGLEWKDPGFAARLKALLELVLAISDHRQAKQDSERGAAVCALAKQALLILKSPPGMMKYSNN